MKVFVFLLYLLLNLIYQCLNEFVEVNARLWYGFHINTQVAFIGYLCHIFRKSSEIDKEGRLLLLYIKLVCIFNFFYIIFCLIINDYVRIHKDTDLTGLIFGLGLLAYSIHSIFKK